MKVICFFVIAAYAHWITVVSKFVTQMQRWVASFSAVIWRPWDLAKANQARAITPSRHAVE